MNINSNNSSIDPSADHRMTYKVVDNEARKKNTEEVEAGITNNQNILNDNQVNNPNSNNITEKSTGQTDLSNYKVLHLSKKTTSSSGTASSRDFDCSELVLAVLAILGEVGKCSVFLTPIVAVVIHFTGYSDSLIGVSLISFGTVAVIAGLATGVLLLDYYLSRKNNIVA